MPGPEQVVKTYYRIANDSEMNEIRTGHQKQAGGEKTGDKRKGRPSVTASM